MRKYDLTRMKRAKARQEKFREFLGCAIIGIVSISALFVVDYLYNPQAKAESASTETSTVEVEAYLESIDEEGNFILHTSDGRYCVIPDPPEVGYKVTFDTKGTQDTSDDAVIGL